MSFNIITPEGEKGFLVPDGGTEGQVLKKTAEGFEWGSALDDDDIEAELNETSEKPVKNRTLFAKFKDIATQIANIAI